ncbi:hypothetical protein [Limosilactobacillus fermentum]
MITNVALVIARPLATPQCYPLSGKIHPEVKLTEKLSVADHHLVTGWMWRKLRYFN